jgi:tetratricopeptide (TPR) repeat protein
MATMLRPLELTLAGAARVRPEQLIALAGHGTTLTVLGGLRSAVASGCWLQANRAWEQRDAASMVTWLELTVAADERPVYYWLNGARMMAYDMPEWRLTDSMPRAYRRKIHDEQAQSALQFLAKGLRWHGKDAALFIEMANLHLRCTGDLAQAAQCYRLAAQQDDAPYYAARIHAELLQKMGRLKEARDWLRQILPRLPEGDAAARKEVVVARIQALEQQLAER